MRFPDPDLLLLCFKLARSAMQGVGDRDGQGLAVRGHGVLRDADHFPRKSSCPSA